MSILSMKSNYIFSLILIMLLMINTVAYGSEKEHKLVSKVGSVCLSMIDEILMPDKETKHILKKILTDGNIKEAEKKAHIQEELNKLNSVITSSCYDLWSYDGWEKETTATIITLMLLSGSDDICDGYYTLAKRYLFNDIKSALLVEKLCVLATINLYQKIKSNRNVNLKKTKTYNAYMEQIERYRKTYEIYIFEKNRDSIDENTSKIKTFEKYYKMVVVLLDEFENKSTR